MIPLLKSVVNAQRRYFITNGKYAEKFDELDVTIPWTGTQKWNTSNPTDTLSNGDWSLQMHAGNDGGHVRIGHLKGAYKGVGLLVYLHYTGPSGYKDNQIYCVEPKNSASYAVTWSGAQGEYCKKMFPDSVLHTPVRSDIPFFLVPGAW